MISRHFATDTFQHSFQNQMEYIGSLTIESNKLQRDCHLDLWLKGETQNVWEVLQVENFRRFVINIGLTYWVQFSYEVSCVLSTMSKSDDNIVCLEVNCLLKFSLNNTIIAYHKGLLEKIRRIEQAYGRDHRYIWKYLIWWMP